MIFGEAEGAITPLPPPLGPTYLHPQKVVEVCVSVY